MRIARFTHGTTARLGVVDAAGRTITDVGSVDRSLPTDVGTLFAVEGGLDRIAGAMTTAPRLDLTEVRLHAPVTAPPTFLAIGLNYAAHVAEVGRAASTVPNVFNKQITCINGPFDPIQIPAAAPQMVDYEGELGLVIGRACRAVTADEARSVVGGYLVVNDVSVRDWQRASPTMTMGKSWDTHGPTGPWVVTADELSDPHALRIRTWVDGALRQDASTADMIHDCWRLIEHLSTAFTLLPGTIIATGTPSGVGAAMTPPGFLRPGQIVRVEIDGIGSIENRVV